MNEDSKKTKALKDLEIGGKMKKIYREQFESYGYSPKSLGCGKGRQNLRFKALSCFVEPSSSLLDFGCGFGDLLSFLTMNEISVQYEGCDVMDVFLDVAREKHTKAKFYKVEMGGYLPNKKKYDNIICSGVFNFKYVKDDDKHQAEVFSIIEQLFLKCKKVLSIDFQTPFVDFKAPNSHYQSIYSLIDFAVTNLSRRFLIDQTYMPYEYCIHIFKDSSIKRPENVFIT